MRDEIPLNLGPDHLLRLYRMGIFPMAESAEEEGFALIEPHNRALLPILGLHIPKRLKKTLRRHRYRITVNTAFEEVITACAAPAPGREETWINTGIRNLFIALHEKGHAHSIECRDEAGMLTGGLYGLAVGSVFCGESMFSNTTDASKIALIHLCARLWRAGFDMLDTQFSNPHLEQFGLYEIPQEEYRRKLAMALHRHPSFSLEHDALAQDPQKLLEAYFKAREQAGVQG